MLIAGLILRLLCLLLPPGDDVNRYLLEGQAIWSGINVWAFAPIEYSMAEGVNHADRATVYPPLAQFVFALVACVSSLGGKIWQILALFFDLGSMAILYRLLATNRQKKYFFILWLSPLPMISFAVGGHYDSLFVFLFLLTLYFRKQGNTFLSALCLGLACGLKFQLLPLVVFFGGSTFFLVFLVVFLTPWCVAYLVFFLPQGVAAGMFFETAHWFTYTMEYASCLPQLLMLGGVNQILTVQILGGLYFVFLLGLWLFQPGLQKSLMLASLALILVYPTVHYWYLYLVLILWVMSPTIQIWWMAHLLMISGVLSYISPGFPHFPLLEFCAYLSLLLPLFLDSKKGKEPTVGVVIPVLSGDADRLSQLLSDLYSQNTTPDQVVVSEGGLKTDLHGQCLGLGVFHISSVSGRGQQIFNGMMTVKTDVILVLHADSRISRDVIRDIKQIMRDQEIVGGCLTHEYQESGSWLRFTQWINWLRVHITGLSFGDQGQFFRRHLLFSHRVFEPAPLMEDVALSLKLSEAGKTSVLKGGVYCSSRQWKGGLVKKLGHARKIAVLVISYLMRRRLGIKQPFPAYYRYYYGS